MSMPALVEPTLTEEHTRSVVDRASGMEAMSFRSASVMPFWTRAEKPPMKLTPVALGRPVQGGGKGGVVVCLRRSGHQGDGGDGDALVDDGDAEFLLDGLAGGHQIFGAAGDLVVDGVAGLPGVAAGAGQQGDAHGDGAHVQMLLVDHLDGLHDLVLIEHEFPPVKGGVARGDRAGRPVRGGPPPSDSVHGVEDVLPLDADGQPLLPARLLQQVGTISPMEAVQAEESTSMTMVKYSWSTVWLMSRMLMLCWASRAQTAAVMPTWSLPMTVTMAFIAVYFLSRVNFEECGETGEEKAAARRGRRQALPLSSARPE